MLEVYVAQSEDTYARAAIAEIFAMLNKYLKNKRPSAGILFCSPELDLSYVVSEIRNKYPDMELAGCTTDGEFSSELGFTDDSVVLMVFVSHIIEIRAGIGKNLASRGSEAGIDAALSARSGLQSHGEECFGIILSDPINAGVSDISQGIGQILGDCFPLFGAASAAHSKQRTTYQFCNDEIVTDSIVLLLFSGPLLFSFGIQGCHAGISGKAKITSSDKNVLYKIGDMPALDYFRRYIGNKYDIFMNYCIAIFEEGREGFYVRNAPFCDSDKGTVTLNGVVTEGAYLQIGTADKSKCIDSCKASLLMALHSYPGSAPLAAVHFSCAGRKMSLGTKVKLEAETTVQYLPDIPFCGFYTYGEFSPLEPGSKSLFHGTSFVTLLMGIS